jgi:hypothetical protein
VGCVGQRVLEHRGHAISRNDIKPHARANDDSSGLRIRVMDAQTGISIRAPLFDRGTSYRPGFGIGVTAPLVSTKQAAIG